MDDNLPDTEKLISSFTEITSSSRELAKSFLETHQWNLNVAVSTFIDEPNVTNPSENELLRCDRTRSPNLRIKIPDSPPSSSEDSSDDSPLQLVRSQSPSDPSGFRVILKTRRPGDDPSELRTSKRRRYEPYGGKIRTFGAVSGETDWDYYSGDDKSDMLEQDPGKAKDVDEIFDRAKELAIERPEESSRSMPGETVSAEHQEQQQDQPHEVVTSTITIWNNGYTMDDSPLRSLDDPENAAFLEFITRLESPRVFSPVSVHVKLIRREENFNEPPTPFHVVGSTLAESYSVSTEPSALLAASPTPTLPVPTMSVLVVDPAAPTTSIQLRLADGTRLVTQFNTHHTVRDIRGFIDTCTPYGSNYQLLSMGFPPKPLLDFDQTIEKAGIANSVLILKF